MSAPCSIGRHRYGRRHGVVHDQRDALGFRQGGDRLDIHDDTARVRQALDKDRLGVFVNGRLECVEVVRIGPFDAPAKALERVVQLVDGTAIELVGRNDVVAGLHQGMEAEQLRGMTGCGRKSGCAAFQGCNALFQNGGRRICDAGVDIAEGLQTEQGGCVIHIIEDEGRRLVDRRGARARGRVGCSTGMNGQRGKPWNIFAHKQPPFGILRSLTEP